MQKTNRGDNKDRRYKRGKEARPTAYGRQEVSLEEKEGQFLI